MEEKHLEIIARAERVRKHLQLNKSRFAGAMGIKPQTYNNFVGFQKSKPNIELLHGLYNIYKVNLPWLLNGEGAMFADASPVEKPLSFVYETPVIRAMSLHEPSAKVDTGGCRRIQERIQKLTVTLARMEKQAHCIENDNLMPIDHLMNLVKRFYQLRPVDVTEEMDNLLSRLAERFDSR